MKAQKKIDELKDRPEWPYLDICGCYLSDFDSICNELGFDPYGRPATGSIGKKAPLLMSKFEKVVLRRRSSMHHLCIIASEFQRPGPAYLKRLLIEQLKKYLQDMREIEGELLQAMEEGAG